MSTLKKLILLSVFCLPLTANAGGAVSTLQLESFLNLSENEIANLGVTLPSNAKGFEGSAVKVNFDIYNGDIIGLVYQILTDEPSSDPYSDYAFLNIGNETTSFDHVGKYSLHATGSHDFDHHTDLLKHKESASVDAPYFSLGILDIVDGEYDSALLLQELTLTRGDQEFNLLNSLTFLGDVRSVQNAGETHFLITTGSFKGSASAVPVPPSFWLMTSALLGLISLNRRSVASD